MQDICVAAVQMNGRMFSVDENLDEVETWCVKAAEEGAELVLFPETLVHGHAAVAEAWSIAEPVPDGPTVRRLEKMARNHRLVLSVGMSEKERDIVYNCQALVGPGGYIGRSRKVHPSMDEGMLFAGGTEMPVFDIGKCVVGQSICYDSQFPEVPRTLALRGAQVILNPNAGRCGQWSSREDEAERVQRIKTLFGRYALRAAENAVFWVTTNQAGVAGHVDQYPADHDLQPHHAGGILFFDPRGELLAESQSRYVEPAMIVCDLRAADLAAARSSPNFGLRNRKPWLYRELMKGPAEQ